jgi:PKD repeat protein
LPETALRAKTAVRSAIAIAALVASLVFAPSAAADPPTGVDFSASWPMNPPLTRPLAGQTVTFTGSVGTWGGPDATTGTLSWSFGDGAGATGATVTHDYAAAGAYGVTMTATNEAMPNPESTSVTKILFVNAPPTAAFTFGPATPLPGQGVLFASDSSDPDGDALAHLWNFGDQTTSAARNPTHAYATPGTKTVRLTVRDPFGTSGETTHAVAVTDPSAPQAAFNFAPAKPVAGQRITFTAAVSPTVGQSITALNWDLDSDGQFDDAKGGTATRRFGSPGVYRVALEVLQSNGTRSVAEGTVRVSSRPALLSPAVVRLRGLVGPFAIRVKVLSVRAPGGARARVRCRGKGCPVKVRRKRIRKKHHVVRFHVFERTLPAGVKLTVFVRKPGTIGKFTRFTIRGNAGPKRVDRCLLPGRRKPVRCPS